MNKATSFIRKLHLLMDLSSVVLFSMVTTTGNRFRLFIQKTLGKIPPVNRADTSLLVNTYELMRNRLQDSLAEIEEKNEQLKMYADQIKLSRDFLQAIIDSLDEELLVLDKDLRIVQANGSVRIKHKGKAIIGSHCYDLKYGLKNTCYIPSGNCPARQVWETGNPAQFTQEISTVGENGNHKYVSVSISPVIDTSGEVEEIVELTRDITASKNLENKIIENNRHLLALNAIAKTASQSLSLEVIVEEVLNKSIELIDATAGSIRLINDNSQKVTYEVNRGIDASSTMDSLVDELVKKVLEKGNMPGTSANVEAETSEAGINDKLIAVPLRSKEKIKGVLTIIRNGNAKFSSEEIQLLDSVGSQLGVVIDNIQLYRELQSKEQMRGELLRHLISVQEAERQRVARELHDVTSQTLATLAVGLDSVAQSGIDTRQSKNQLEKLRSMLANTSRDVHRLIYDLRPSLLDDLGLFAALNSLANSSLKPAGVQVHFEIAGRERRLPAEVEIAIFRIVQEAVRNIVRHAKAESAYICLEFQEKSIIIQIEDDGIGFDTSREFSYNELGQGLGILGMRERAELLKGTLEIDSKPGSGTRITAEIPVSFDKDNG